MFDYNAQLPDELFDEMKEIALTIRDDYDDTYGYATDKKDSIKDMGNIRGNIRHIYGMFDWTNQKKVYILASELLKGKIKEINEYRRNFNL